MEAKRRGATIIHVDPRFTRTGGGRYSRADSRRVGHRLPGRLVRYILENERYFREYVVNYTNAAAMITEEFRDTEDLDGLFSGWRPEKNQYEHRRSGFTKAWTQSGRRKRTSSYGNASPFGPGRPNHSYRTRRARVSDSNRHFARYTPEMVEKTVRYPPELFSRVAETCATTPGANALRHFVYAVGWTQHTVGVQIHTDGLHHSIVAR